MRVLVSLLVLLTCGCVTTLPAGSPDFAVVVEVSDLKAEERALLQEGVCGLSGVKDCKLEIVRPAPPQATKKKRRRKKKVEAPPPEDKTPTVRVRFVYAGDPNQLRRDLGTLPHPGLEPQTAATTLVFKGFDNLAPRLEIISPREKDEKVFTQVPVPVEVKVEGEDVKGVTVDGVAAARTVKGPWRAEIVAKEGTHRYVAKVVDNDGNERETSVVIELDTTPPTVDISVEPIDDGSAWVRGRIDDGVRVRVDNRDMKLDGDRFEIKVRMDPDKRSVRVELWDEHDNKALEVWNLDTKQRESREVK